MSDLPYRALWRQELNAGLRGQHSQLTATWKLDNLWRAAVLQYQAEELLVMLGEAVDANDAPHVIASFLEKYNAACAACAVAFLGGEVKNAAA